MGRAFAALATLTVAMMIWMQMLSVQR